MDLSQFADPWEQLRLLSDAPRNALLIELLRRRAPGARVLEVGCGTGLLSCAAAALGAIWRSRATPASTPFASVRVRSASAFSRPAS